jgi:hypothetical protein
MRKYPTVIASTVRDSDKSDTRERQPIHESQGYSIKETPYGRADKQKASKWLLAALKLATPSPQAEGSWRLARATALETTVNIVFLSVLAEKRISISLPGPDHSDFSSPTASISIKHFIGIFRSRTVHHTNSIYFPYVRRLISYNQRSPFGAESAKAHNTGNAN